MHRDDPRRPSLACCLAPVALLSALIATIPATLIALLTDAGPGTIAAVYLAVTAAGVGVAIGLYAHRTWGRWIRTHRNYWRNR